MSHESQLKEAHVVRVFFSSPFGGMEGEREELTRLYLPRLHSLCQARGLRFVATDLRWGITTEAADSAQTLTICLRELDRADVFVGFYGQRYGWHSIHGGGDGLLARNFELAAVRYPWVMQYQDRSVTELEFLHGHLNQPGSLPSIICFRDKSYDDKMKDRAIRNGDDKTVKKFISESPEALRKLQDLRKQCEKTKDKSLAMCVDYKTPAEAAKIIFEALWQHLTSVVLKEDENTLTPLQRMRAEHDAFRRTRTRHFFDGDPYFRRLDQLHDEGIFSNEKTEESAAEGSNNDEPVKDGRPKAVVVTGPRGIGRSALLCNWLEHRRRKETDDIIINHFVGTARDSTGRKTLVRRLYNELVEATKELDRKSDDESGGQQEQSENSSPPEDQAKPKETAESGNKADNAGQTKPVENDPPDRLKEDAIKDEKEKTEKERKEKEKEESLSEIIDKFKERLKKVEEGGRKVILVIDGLEKVETAHKSHKVLFWLPDGLPGCVTMVVSCLDSEAALMKELVTVRRFHTLTVLPLARETQQQLCVVSLHEGGKELSPPQLARIVEAPQTENPLYLTIMLHELSVFGRFRGLDEKIDSLLGCKGVFELFDCFLQRLEEDYNTSEFPNLVQKVCSAISLSRFGLSEEELMEMLAIPSHLWSPLYFALDSYVIKLRSSGNMAFIRFLFSELDDAVRSRYLKDEDFKTKLTREMIEFFEKEKKLFRPWMGGKHDSCERAADELPALCKSLDDKEGLIRTITHLGIFSKIYDRVNGEYEILEMYTWTGLSWSQIVERYFQAFDEGVVESYLHMESMPHDAWTTTPSYSMKSLMERVKHVVELGGGNAAAQEAVLLRCIEICEGAKGKADEKKRYEDLASFKYDLACLYVDDERFREAEQLHLDLFKERKKSLEENRDDEEIQKVYAFSCNGLGLLYYRMKSHEKAIEYLEMSLDMHKKRNSKRFMADNHTNLGLVHMDQGSLSKAKAHLETSIQLYTESSFGRKTHVLGNALTNLALVHRRMRNLDEAERMYFEALEIKKNAVGEFNPIVATCWMNLGTVAIHKKDPVKMEEYTRKALYILELNDAPEDSRTRWMCTENLLMALVKQKRIEEGLQIFNDLHAIMLRKDKIDECLPFVHAQYVEHFLDKKMYQDAERVLFPLLRSTKRRAPHFILLARLNKENPPSEPRPPELTLDRGVELFDSKDLWMEFFMEKIRNQDSIGVTNKIPVLKTGSSPFSCYLEVTRTALRDPDLRDAALIILKKVAAEIDNNKVQEVLLDACIEQERYSEALECAERQRDWNPDRPFSTELLLKAATVALHCQAPDLALDICDVIFSRLGDDDPGALRARELLQKFDLQPRERAP